MSAFSNYLENELIDAIFRARSYTFPTELHVALYTAAPSDAGGGTEVTGGSYARAPLAPLFSNWAGTGGESTAVDSAGTGGVTSNLAAITFPAPTANWGQATHFGIFDASAAGNLLFHGALTTPKTINNGDPAPTFGIGDLTVTLA